MAGSAELAAAAAPRAIAEAEVANMHQFIENALDLVLKGNAKSYQYLLQQLAGAPGQVDPLVRRRIFLALPRCISTMAKEPHAYRQLLDALFKFDFLGDTDETRDYAQFVTHLVSSNTVYVVPTLQMLLRNLCRPQTLPPALQAAQQKQVQQPKSTGIKISIGGSFGSTAPAAAEPAAPAIDVEAKIQERFERVHETLQRVLALAPTATNVLFPVICEHFPHKRLEAVFQVAYLKNVLRLSTYTPGLRERIFGLVVDQLVAIDVEIKLDESEEDVFTMDDFLDDDLLPPEGDHVDEMADKLDQMMLIMFEHIEQSTRDDTARKVEQGDQPPPPPAAEEDGADVHRAALIFKYLLKVFEHSILNTHRSKYPQFLLFYVCRLDPQFQDVFISQLLASSLDPQTPPIMRQSCGAYLASFLARAKYISVAYLQKALYHLLKWLHDQMDVYDATQQQAKTEDENEEGELETTEAALENDKVASFQESIYVSTLQTVCYLICFRGLEIAQHENGYDFLRSLGWERLLITSTAYCPLAFCQPTVSVEFLNFVETLDLISEECIDRVDQAISASSKSVGRSKGKSMERSAKPSASGWQASSATAILGQRQPLETFFPFDPYLLRRSFKFIGPLYLYWKHADPTSSDNCEALNAVKAVIRELQAEDDDNDDDSDEEEEEDVSMAGSAPIKDGSYMDSRHNSYMSVGSSFDGQYDDDDDELRTASPKRHKRVLPARNTFDPSPALSASSPPSRLPPLGTASAFVLGGFDDDDDDGF